MKVKKITKTKVPNWYFVFSKGGITIKEEIFYSNKIEKDIKIAIIADIHYYPKYNTKILTNIINQIKTNKPDYLIIAGDILDKSNYEYQGLLEFLKELTKYTKIIMTLGNHDIYYRLKRKKSIEEINNNFINDLASLNKIYLLRDNTFIENKICFYGFDLDYEYYYRKKEKITDFINKVDKLNTKLDSNNYNITIFHSPVNIYEYINKYTDSNLAKSDFIISGHMHNGCLPYCFTNIINKTFKINHSLISPNRHLFPDYSQGRVYKIRDGIIYEGISKLSKSSVLLHKLDFLYHKKVKFITIKRVDN